MLIKLLAVFAVVLGAGTLSSAISSHAAAEKAITADDVRAAQESWGEGIVSISKVHAEKGDYQDRAAQHIKDLYAYDHGGVCFKPTLAAEDQFRGTFDEALSYFVGGSIAEDKA